MRPHGQKLPSKMHSRMQMTHRGAEIMPGPPFDWTPPQQQLHIPQQDMSGSFIPTPSTSRDSGGNALVQHQQPLFHTGQQQVNHPQYHLMQTPQQQLQQNQQAQHHPHMSRHYTPSNPTPGPSGVSGMTTQWYTPPRPTGYFNNDIPLSNSREMRNRAEKLRRDKLNSYIGECASLVPMVSGSAKRMDKTSILRLTATHLRIHHTLLNGNTPNAEYGQVDPNALNELIYDQLEGFLLILTPNGKIIFVSHTVEQLLGHLQTDLMGQSIYTIASSDDHDKLKVHLSPDLIDIEWRRYFNVSLAKAGPRTESPNYEQFNVMGVIRQSRDSSAASTSSSSTSSTCSKVNDNVLVFFVKLYRPPSLSEMLIEATKDEYITRHLVDGRIINCDHRISFVAGYMIEEVSGLSAFKFMHRDDVRWTMICLRQMYDKGESVGWSCYRLLSRTGQFIYLRTFGYLEVDSAGVLESFVCVNTLVSEEEGQKLIKEMKERYSVMISAASSPTPSEGSVASVEDPQTLAKCIKYLITDRLTTSPKTESSTSPNPSILCNEIEDCYLTDLDPQMTALPPPEDHFPASACFSPSDPPLIRSPEHHHLTELHEYPSSNKHSKRISLHDGFSDDDHGASRKRQKRRTMSSSSISSAELLDSYQCSQDSNSSGANLVCTQPAAICRPNSSERRHKDQNTVYQTHNLLTHNLGM